MRFGGLVKNLVVFFFFLFFYKLLSKLTCFSFIVQHINTFKYFIISRVSYSCFFYFISVCILIVVFFFSCRSMVFELDNMITWERELPIVIDKLKFTYMQHSSIVLLTYRPFSFGWCVYIIFLTYCLWLLICDL